MEYKNLNNLENAYPQPGNYILNRADKSMSNLYGIYPDKNRLDFKLPSLADIKSVEGTNFRFILAIFKDYQDTKPVYYTSDKYLNDLISASAEGNPYFLQSSFSNTNIVSYVYEDIIKMVDSMKPLEQKSRVDFRINIFAGVSGSVEYDNLVTYIDWLVDKQSPLDDINFGVLQPETISGWNVLDGNFATGEIKTTISASYGIGSQFVSIFDSTQLDLESDLKLQREKLERIQFEIDRINLEIKTKSNYKYPDLINPYTTIGGSRYNARKDVNAFRRIRGNSGDIRERQQYVTERLTEELNILNPQKISAEQAVGEAQNKFNAAKKAAEDTINKAKAEAERLKNLAGDLMNKIPKIPKLPAIPKIPKLPTLAALGAMALALVPPLPALPKLPSLPKKPSFKLPPLKLFKPKKPKEPKKIKKNKGKGLKGALGDLQDAANSAQGAVAGAAAAAAGAAAAAVAAANQAKAAAANAKAAVDNAKAAVQSGIDNAKSTVKGAVDNVKSTVEGAVDNVKNNIPKV
jgi:hypothetical protein